MKYKVGDELFYKDYGTKFKNCTVVNALESSNRYRIKYLSSWDNKYIDGLKKETELFSSLDDAINFYIAEEKKKIEYIQKQIDEMEKIRIK